MNLQSSSEGVLFVWKMAWRTHASSNKGLVEGLVKEGIVKSQAIRSAMESVDRANFVDKAYAYDDNPVTIGHGQVNAMGDFACFLSPLFFFFHRRLALHICTHLR